MPTFTYEAVARSGAASRGTLDAPSRAAAVRQLTQQGLTAKRVKETAGGAKPAKAAKPAKKAKPARGNSAAKPSAAAEPVAVTADGPLELKIDQLIVFTEDLADFLVAGLTLEQALSSMEKQHASTSLGGVCKIIREAITEGTSFGHALTLASPSFDELYCSLATAGEASGALAPILTRQAEYLTTMRDMKRKVTSALIYPAFLVFAGILVAGLMIFYLLPEISSLIEDSEKPPPFATRMLMGFSDFCVQNWMWMAGAGALVIAAVVYFFRAPGLKDQRDEVYLKTPLISKLLWAEFNLLFTETIANLIGNGLPLLRATELTRNATTNVYFRGQLDEVIEYLADGAALSSAMRAVGGFSPALIDVAAVGERTGSLEKALRNAARRLRRDLEVLLERITSLIQPVIITAMALLVGSVVYMMITAIFDVVTAVTTG
ncbi:type II secretion system F family protein [Sulfuriroseicoccus oceanibius]|uniref:General secretion pathway protein F n=1 Tax=Sulfuriroseicoccus oceanibius TaxID=2707525 RepID=A0A6B3LDA1_9BACT|nr:type II secretion system F family protein [Sulfuriroseicoccus oceanibius]QQL44819.1 type II secretion system F family protein [Sulfuriroseicoccus oceanibius]